MALKKAKKIRTNLIKTPKEIVLKKLFKTTIWQNKSSASQVKSSFLKNKYILSDDAVTINEAGKMINDDYEVVKAFVMLCAI